MNVVTNPLNWGGPVERGGDAYLNDDGVFDHRSLLTFLEENSDLSGSKFLTYPFPEEGEESFSYLDEPLLLSVIADTQFRREEAIKDDPVLKAGRVSSRQDKIHCIVLAARAFEGDPEEEITLTMEYEDALRTVLKKIRGLRRNEMGIFLHKKVALYSDISKSWADKLFSDFAEREEDGSDSSTEASSNSESENCSGSDSDFGESDWDTESSDGGTVVRR